MHKFKRLDYSYILCYCLILLFFMRWDILYSRNLIEMFTKQLPKQVLCLCLGLGLEYVIYATIFIKDSLKKFLIGSTYFVGLIFALENTSILWTRYTDLQQVALISVIIGLVQIIQKNRLGTFSEGTKKCLGTIFFIILAFFISIDIAYNPRETVQDAIAASLPNTGEDALWSVGLETLRGLDKHGWAKLSVQEKLNLMQTVANIEINHLGLGAEVPVKATGLGKNINACYSSKKNTIFMNNKRLEYSTANEMINSVAHETYHAYQAKIVKLYEKAGDEDKQLLHFRKLKQYKKEMENYSNGEQDYKAYYSQLLERDAREYGAKREYYYRQRLKLL